MPNLVETPSWEAGVYQLETNDDAIGGAGGIANRQAEQLANRTAYLKALQEAHAAAADPHPQYMTEAESNAAIANAVAALVNSSPAALNTLAEFAAALGNDPNFASTITNALAGKQPLDTDLTAISALVSAADKMIYSTGAGTWSQAALTAFARTLLDDADAATMRTTLGAVTQADINTAIANLVSSSPVALNTLNELASALGNDPNFATTITNALAAKAPLASPALTGEPTAPTPAQFDVTTKLATMAALQRALGGGIGYTTAGQTIPASAANSTIYLGGSATTVILPLLSSVPVGTRLTFAAVSVTSCTISRQGTDTIWITSTYSTNTSIVVKAGDTLELVAMPFGWVSVAGSAMLAYQGTTGLFGASLAASGYQKLPSGLIVQWGFDGSNSVGPTTVTFPIAFPSLCAVVFSQPNKAGGAGYSSVSGKTLGNYTVYKSEASFGCFWVALGF